MKIWVDCDGPIFDGHQLWNMKYRHKTAPPTYYGDVKWETWDNIFGNHDEFNKACLTDSFYDDCIHFINPKVDVIIRHLSNDHDVSIVSDVPSKTGYTIRSNQIYGLLGKDLVNDCRRIGVGKKRWEFEGDILIDDNYVSIMKWCDKPKHIGYVWARPWNIQAKDCCIYDNIFWVWSWWEIKQRIDDLMEIKEG